MSSQKLVKEAGYSLRRVLEGFSDLGLLFRPREVETPGRFATSYPNNKTGSTSRIRTPLT